MGKLCGRLAVVCLLAAHDVVFLVEVIDSTIQYTLASFYATSMFSENSGRATGFMRDRNRHREFLWRGALIASALALMSGCWEEIHYTPSAADSAASRSTEQGQAGGQLLKAPSTGVPSPLTDEAAARDFADDLAAKLPATKLTTVKPADATTWPVNDSSAARLPWEEPASAPKNEGTINDPSRNNSLVTAQPSAETATPVTPSATPAETTASPTTTTTAPSQPASDTAHSPRRIAWLLGNKLSLSALANDRGGADDETAKLFSQARTLAEMLDTTVGDLPPARAAVPGSTNFDRALQYLFAQGQSIGRVLATKYGDDHAALFELAVKSNILLALYRPRASVTGALSSAIEQAGGRSGLPVKLWQPLMDAMANNAPAEDVRQAVYRLHAEADHYLSTTPDSAPGVATQSQ
jgi:hypothetical protein